MDLINKIAVLIPWNQIYDFFQNVLIISLLLVNMAMVPGVFEFNDVNVIKPKLGKVPPLQ